MDTRLDDLPTLTPKQTAFVNALLEGKSASDAYREAYNCERMSHGAIAVEASRLRRTPKISLWLRYYQRVGADAAQLTMKTHLAELARARELAIAHGQIAASVQAEHYRGKASGLYEQRVHLTCGPSDEELLRAIGDMLGRETAEALAAALGVVPKVGGSN
jgi:phage terminase small subunit